MGAEIFQVQGKDTVIRINQFAAINALQNFDWDAKFNEEQLQELGNENYASQTITPEVGGSFESTATGSTVALLKRMISKVNAGTGAFEGYLAGFAGADVGFGGNEGTLRGRDLERAVFDVVESKKPNSVFERSTLFPRMHLATMALKAQSNGTATESYTFEGDFLREYNPPYHDLVAIPAKRNSATEIVVPTEYELSVNPGTALNTDYVVVHVMVDEVVVPRSALTLGTVVEPAADTLTLGGGFTAPLGARLSVVAYKKLPGTLPTIEYPTSARFVKADAIDIFLIERTDIGGVSDNCLSYEADGDLLEHASFTTANRLLRAQSADINIDLRREALRQIAKTDTGNSVYYRATTYPLSVTSSVSMMETSVAEWAKLQGVDITVEGNYLDLKQFENKVWQIVVRYYYNGEPVQVVAICDARVNANSRRVAAGGRAEVTWGFMGSDVVIEAVDF